MKMYIMVMASKNIFGQNQKFLKKSLHVILSWHAMKKIQPVTP
jgi:hypothetical protein